jgi:hypothetical protein
MAIQTNIFRNCNNINQTQILQYNDVFFNPGDIAYYDGLCWVDTDIVFKENPIDLIKDQIEILFQSDRHGSTLCSGFMVFNSSSECEELIKECSSNTEEDDQLLVNRLALDKYYDNVALLSQDLFPNGHVYYKENKKENAVIVHNNWMIGVNTKIQHFKKENLWYL